MKIDIEATKKATELIDMFYDINNPKKEDLGTRPYIDKDYAAECAAIYAREQSVEMNNAVIKLVNDNMDNPHRDDFNLDYLIDRYVYWQIVLSKIFIRKTH